MLTEELDILNIVAEAPDTSQRKIAQQAGISLGQVNFLLKKCAKIGLIKIEGQTPKSLRYNLTPKGMAEKADKTLRYIKASYSAVQIEVARIGALCQTYKDKGLHIYLVGNPDEMMEICKLACTQAGTPFKIGAPPPGDDAAVVFCWDQETEEKYMQAPHVNLLKVQP